MSNFPARPSGMVNIPRSVVDDYYRYRMPILRAKVEGRGNGIKTRIENMADIAQALHRPADYTTKFLGYELGAQTHINSKSNAYVVNGRHSPEALADKLDLFIERFLLCSLCHNPETIMEVSTKPDIINLRCKACGGLTNVDIRYRLATYILKHPPQNKMTAESKKSSNPNQQHQHGDYSNESTAVASGDQVDDDYAKETWSEDFLSNDAIEKRQIEMFGSSRPKSLLNSLKDYFENLENPPADIIATLNKFAYDNALKNSTLRLLSFSILFQSEILKTMKLKIPFLKAIFPTPLEQKYLLYAIERLCEYDRSTIALIPSILNILFENDVLDENIVYEWHDYPHEQLNHKLSKEIRNSAYVFVNWLKTAEEDEE